jgi:hypothetical protein
MRIFFLLLFITTFATAQQYFVGVSIDPSMSLNGPGHSYDQTSTLDIEFRLGVEVDNLRIAQYLELHRAINYKKWTLLAVDYVVKDKILWFDFEGFKQYAGLETSTINRYFTDASYDQPNNFREKETSWSYGANIEIQYRLTKMFYIGAGLNAFKAEKVLQEDNKKMRYDGMITLYAKI